jgi:hypothetical protein
MRPRPAPLANVCLTDRKVHRWAACELFCQAARRIPGGSQSTDESRPHATDIMRPNCRARRPRINRDSDALRLCRRRYSVLVTSRDSRAVVLDLASAHLDRSRCSSSKASPLLRFWVVSCGNFSCFARVVLLLGARATGLETTHRPCFPLVSPRAGCIIVGGVRERRISPPTKRGQYAASGRSRRHDRDCRGRSARERDVSKRRGRSVRSRSPRGIQPANRLAGEPHRVQGQCPC